MVCIKTGQTAVLSILGINSENTADNVGSKNSKLYNTQLTRLVARGPRALQC